jgi:hypothetical protein
LKDKIEWFINKPTPNPSREGSISSSHNALMP